ncbi:hypothetical protein Golax_004068, partial [Gossypium laxum]|nr:hypothetical protein [Gossypium laxum]
MCWLLWKNWNKLVFSNCHNISQEIIDKGINWAKNYMRTSYHVLQYSPMGFSRLLGKEVIFKIKAIVILEGLHLAWEKGIRQLEVESDNALLIETIVEGGIADSQIMELRGIHQVVCRGWKVCFHHVPRNHNDVVDHTAKVMATTVTKIQVFEVPPHS